MTSWNDLPIEEQLRLREAYGEYLDSLPPTCEMQAKLDHFNQWLAQFDIVFQPE